MFTSQGRRVQSFYYVHSVVYREREGNYKESPSAFVATLQLLSYENFAVSEDIAT